MNTLIQLRSISNTLTVCSNALTLCTQKCFHRKKRSITCQRSEASGVTTNIHFVTSRARYQLIRGPVVGDHCIKPL